MPKKELEYFNGDELAASVWRNKYALEHEVNPDEMHMRLAKEFARIEMEYEFKEIRPEKYEGLSSYGKNRFRRVHTLDETVQRIYSYFKDFKYIIPQGSIMSVLGTNIIGSLSNCFVLESPHDSYSGIMQKDEEMAQLMKRRGGVGIDISTLRPAGTKVNNSAKTSTGATSFMERYSNTCREVAQQGRRGALMLTIDVRHPDIFDFVTKKQDLSKVTGANVSVLLRDDFMQAVKADKDYTLRFPCDIDYEILNIESFEYNVLYTSQVQVGMYFKRIRAKELYDLIVKCAWTTAEPGQAFINQIHNWSPDGVYEEYKAVASNPCGEQWLPAYDSCRLICENLYSFVTNPFTPEAQIDKKLLYEMSYEQLVLADNLVDLELEHIQTIIDKLRLEKRVTDTELNLWLKVKDITKKSRRVGCGITALADMLAALGLDYGSPKSIEVTEEVMRIKMQAELDATIDLGILRGSFEGQNSREEFTTLENNYTVSGGKNDFYQMLYDNFLDTACKMFTYGRRNISWSTIAPTGSLSLLTRTAAAGEPLFMSFYQRNKKIQGNEIADFTDAQGDKWKTFLVVHPKLVEYIKISLERIEEPNIESELERICSDKDTLQKWFELSPYNNSTANQVHWEERLKIQAALQRYTTNAISSTINLPQDITEEIVGKIYLTAWELGLKGCTVYRDTCRTGVLNKIETKQPEERPNSIYGILYRVGNYNVIVGHIEVNIKTPYEIFAYKDTTYLGTSIEGIIYKRKDKSYVFEYYDTNDDGSLKEVSQEITEAPTAEERAVARLVSASLRGGADVKFLVEQLMKTEGSLQSINFALAKVLGTFIPDGTKSSLSCINCGSLNVIFEEGCNKCLDCGSSKCG